MVASVVVWWTIDSLRQDITSTYGGDVQTGNLSKLAANGQKYDGRSLATWTLPSVTSILTGAPPDHHGVTCENKRLSPGTPTLPQYFRAEGWHTVGIVANPWFSRRKGLDIGFDRFYNITEDRGLYREVPLRSLLSYLIHVRTRNGGMTLDMDRHPSEPLIADLAVKELRRADRPVFLMVHTQGVHSPYHHPPAWNRHRDNANPRRAAYYNLVEFVDAQLGRFINELPEDSVIVATSDHGEALGELGNWGHKIPDLDMLHQVPLIINGGTPTFSNPVTHTEVNAWLRDEVAPTNEEEQRSEQLEERLEALGYVDGSHTVR